MAFTLTRNPLLEDRLRNTLNGRPRYDGPRGPSARRPSEIIGYDSLGGPPGLRPKGKPKSVRRPGSKPGEMGGVESFDRSLISGDKPWWWATEKDQFNYEFWRKHFAGLEQLPEHDRNRIEKDREKLNGIAQKLLGGDYSPGTAFQLWSEAINEAEAGSMVGDPRTPWEVLERWTGNTDLFDKESPLGKSLAGYQGPRVLTRTQRSINLTDPKTAQAVARHAAQQELGRRINDEEFAEFLATLNGEEQANATVTTTTTNLDEEGREVSSSTETTGGTVNPTGMAASWIDEEKNIEADTMRAASFLDVLRSL